MKKRMQHACSAGVDYELWKGNQAYRMVKNRDYLGRAVRNSLTVFALKQHLGKFMRFYSKLSMQG